MSLADSSNSITVSVVSTRRSFLSQAAGVAAGGTVLALAAIPPASATAAPMASLAPSEVDPIFALIEDYRTAVKTLAAAASEHDRREEVLIEQGLGLSPFISVLEMRSGPYANEPVMVYKREYVDIHIPPDRFRELNADAHAAFDAKIEQHKAVVGDSEKVMYAAMDAETEALGTLVWTTPTTIAGVLTLLELLPDLLRARIGADEAAALIVSVIEALRDLHPNARSANARGRVR